MAKQDNKRSKLPAETLALVKIEAWTRLGLLLIKTVGYCWCATMLYKAVVAVAGKTTIVDFALNLLANMNVNKWVAYSLGATGVGYGLWQRRVRQKAIERFSPLVKEKEQRLDPKRSSSGLRVDGRTQKGDE